jgi:hypothetical protein
LNLARAITALFIAVLWTGGSFGNAYANSASTQNSAADAIQAQHLSAIALPNIHEHAGAEVRDLVDGSNAVLTTVRTVALAALLEITLWRDWHRVDPKLCHFATLFIRAP